MSTKTRNIYPTAELPSLHAKSGRHPGEPVPLRWLAQLVDDIRAAIPTESERDSAMLFGAENLRVAYTDELTGAEVMSDRLAEQEALIAAIAAELVDGQALPPERVSALRRKLGLAAGNDPGTPAVPAGPTGVNAPGDELQPPTDDERRAAFMAYFEAAGWKLPVDMLPLRNDLPRLGYTAAEVERWLGLAAGSLSA